MHEIKEGKEASRTLEILIIDDDRIIHLLHSRCVEKCQPGFPVTTVENGLKALEFLESHRAPGKHFLLLLDINMPVMNGWDFLEALKDLSTLKNIKIIMVTSSIDQYDKRKADNYPNVIGFIEKPITADNCKKIKSFPELKNLF